MSELDIIKLIQSIHNDFFDYMFQGITLLGESSVMLLIILCIYWAYNKKYGEYLAYSYFTSCMLNTITKNIFKGERPVGKEGILTLTTEKVEGYSFPSGHTQGAASTYFALALFNKKRYILYGSIILILLIGVSRLYLGVHYPRDVIVGVVLGIITAAITYYFYHKIENKFLLYLMTLIIFIPGIFITSIDFEKSLGIFTGFILGRMIENHYLKFEIDAKAKTKMIRCFVGSIIVLLINTTLTQILGHMSAGKFISYSMTSLIGFGVYPMFFKLIK